jgi:hypothetical protein
MVASLTEASLLAGPSGFSCAALNESATPATGFNATMFRLQLRLA